MTTLDPTAYRIDNFVDLYRGVGTRMNLVPLQHPDKQQSMRVNTGAEYRPLATPQKREETGEPAAK